MAFLQIYIQKLSSSLSSSQAQDQVDGRFLLNVVIVEGAAILELLARKDQALLVRGDAFLVLHLGLDVLNRVRGLDLEGDGLASQGLDEDLHATAQTKDKVEGALLLDVVIVEGAAILKLLASEDQALLVRGDALLVLDLGLDILDVIRGLDLEGNGLAGEGLDEDLHDAFVVDVCLVLMLFVDYLLLALFLLARLFGSLASRGKWHRFDGATLMYRFDFFFLMTRRAQMQLHKKTHCIVDTCLQSLFNEIMKSPIVASFLLGQHFSFQRVSLLRLLLFHTEYIKHAHFPF